MVHQLTKVASAEEFKAGLGSWHADHDRTTWLGTGTGVALTAAYVMSKGDPIAGITEEKARATYELLF